MLYYRNKNDLTWKIFFVFIFSLFLESMYVYFFWSIPFVIPGIVSIFSITFLLSKKSYFSFERQSIVPFLLFFITLLYTKRDQNLNGFLGGILPFVSIFMVFSLKAFYKAKLLKTITKILSLILSISLIAWFLVQLGINLPKSNILYRGGEAWFNINCYYFFIEYTHDIIFQRFMSVFIEAGYLGALLAILIYVNNFDLKQKEILILFISLIFTFSLAGYLMLAVGYISHLLKNKRNAIQYLFIFGVLIALLYNYAINYNNGYNVFNLLIVERMKINDDGKLSGYNRTSKVMDNMFDNFLKSDDIVLGMGKKYQQFGSNVGYKPFTIANGILGLFLLMFTYLSGYYYNRRLFTLTICIFYIMIFSKGHSEIFWAGYLMIYATSMYLPDNWREVYFNNNIELA